MPPLPATYQNIATKAWALVQTINSRNAGSSLTTFLGPAGTAVMEIHFPSNWLDQIKINALGTIPAPQLDDLRKAMSYTDLTAFETACASTHKNLWSVLKMFSSGANFAGIAYNKTIYVKSAKKNELDLILHELVHTLQWKKFGPVKFLRSYIEGFTKKFTAVPPYGYTQNPAEARAYYFQDAFVRKAPPNVKNVALAIRTTKAIDGGVARKVVGQLMAMKSLNITEASASQGMS